MADDVLGGNGERRFEVLPVAAERDILLVGLVPGPHQSRRKAFRARSREERVLDAPGAADGPPGAPQHTHRPVVVVLRPVVPGRTPVERHAKVGRDVGRLRLGEVVPQDAGTRTEAVCAARMMALGPARIAALA